MSEVTHAELFADGEHKAVRLPHECRFWGKRASIRRVGRGLPLEPVDFDVEAWFAAIDSCGCADPFTAEGREQPLTSDLPEPSWSLDRVPRAGRNSRHPPA
jgi:antitoxin VapB